MLDRNFVLNLCQTSSDINEYLMSLYNIPVQMNAKTIVEIGSGKSTFALVAAANAIDGHVTSIDVGGWDTLNRVPNGVETMKNEKNFTMIEGNSLEVPLINGIDFLLLDSEHTLPLTKHEIERWFPLVVGGGIIALHDTGHEDSNKQGARIALDEYIKKNEDSFTVIHLQDTKLIGMSILTRLWSM